MDNNLKTYAETQGEKAFDWWAAIKKAELLDAERRTPEQDQEFEDFSEDISERADSWVTYACGNQCYVIPRAAKGGYQDLDYIDSYRPKGSPIDAELNKLGELFFNAISNQNWEYARCLLDQIERRSAYLIDQINGTS